MTKIEDIIKGEKSRLKETTSSKISAEILFNLIFLKSKFGNYNDKYKDIKLFFSHYIQSKEEANFGYDNLNYAKIVQLLDLLTPIEKVSIINYFESKLAKELPEANREWFIEKKHEYEISLIIHNKDISKYPKALFLFLGENLTRLFSTLLIFFTIACLLLSPAFSDNLVLFEIHYEGYSDIFILNHILNILSLFSDLDNNLRITPISWIGLLLVVIGKISFILLIVNFIYIKITDKISLR